MRKTTSQLRLVETLIKNELKVDVKVKNAYKKGKKEGSRVIIAVVEELDKNERNNGNEKRLER